MCPPAQKLINLQPPGCHSSAGQGESSVSEVKESAPSSVLELGVQAAVMSEAALAVWVLLCVSVTSQERLQVVYKPPQIPAEAHFAESFDTGSLERRWVLSQAVKQGEGEEKTIRYDGQWSVEEPAEQPLPGNRGMVLKSPGRHHAIAAPLRTAFHFQDKPLIVQYEVQFQQGMECGGAYIKLLSHSEQLHLPQFSDVTPYSVMFGPDCCGQNHTLHFIIRHWDARTGQYQERHARQPELDLSEYFTDRRPHLYTLNLYPDNHYEIQIDQSVISKGSLLTDTTLLGAPPREVADPSDTKPSDWDDRPLIPDPMVTRPVDWDEDAPPQIPDPLAQRPSDWLEEEPPLVPDPHALRPQDWDEEMDGEWEAPWIPNPACKHVIGCGPWIPPMISNPAYRGKWKTSMITNPNYQGQWHPRLIPNPEYVEEGEGAPPVRPAPVGAVGLELWALTGGVLFDNVLVCGDRRVAQYWTEQTWGQRLTAERILAPGVVQRLLGAAMKRPWLWGVYVFTVALPVVLFISFVWPDKRFGPPDMDYYYKKSDEPQPDDPEESEEPEGQRKAEAKRSSAKAGLEVKPKPRSRK